MPVSEIRFYSMMLAFSFFLGWKEFMPIWNVPSIQEVVGEGPGVTTPVVAGPTPFG